jgi:hypothetical protein
MFGIADMSDENFCICSWGVETIGFHEREPNSLMLQDTELIFCKLD